MLADVRFVRSRKRGGGRCGDLSCPVCPKLCQEKLSPAAALSSTPYVPPLTDFAHRADGLQTCRLLGPVVFRARKPVTQVVTAEAKVTQHGKAATFVSQAQATQAVCIQIAKHHTSGFCFRVCCRLLYVLAMLIALAQSAAQTR